MEYNNRILVVDDNESIHKDFMKILGPSRLPTPDDMDALETALFEAPPVEHPPIDFCYDLDYAFQGEEAYDKIEKAESTGKPYACAFMDVRMPPGWDGIETIRHIWSSYPDIEVVIVSAYSDYSWEDIIEILGPSDRLLFLPKPFNTVAVKQAALVLTKKRNLTYMIRDQVKALEKEVKFKSEQLNRLLANL